MDWNQVLGVAIVVVVIIIGWFGSRLYLKTKDAKEKTELALSILEVVDFVAKRLEGKIKFPLSSVILYTEQAISLIIETAESESNEEQLELMKATALAICTENGIEIDESVQKVVDIIVDFIFGFIDDDVETKG